MDLLVLDLSRRSMRGGGLGIVCDGFVCEVVMRARLCLWWEVVDAGRFVLALAHVLAAPYFRVALERLQGNEAFFMPARRLRERVEV